MTTLQGTAGRPTVIIAAGDPAGIGPEVAVKAALDARVRASMRPILVAHPELVAETCALLALPSPEVRLVNPAEDLSDLPGDALWVVPPPCPLERTRPGVASASAGRMAAAYFEEAIRLTDSGFGQSLVTAPLHKGNLAAARAPYRDHTDGLASMLGVAGPRTVFETGDLRIFFATRHLSLRDALDALHRDLLVDLAERAAADLLGLLGVERPRLALAALNPHAGDGGLFGREEIEILAPAVEVARARGINLAGPLPADAVFHLAASGHYDAVLSLYHDQGHIAAKTRDFFGTISYTLGLPFLRTSPDHGSALDIAGQGDACARSMVLACLAAAERGRRWREK